MLVNKPPCFLVPVLVIVALVKVDEKRRIDAVKAIVNPYGVTFYVMSENHRLYLLKFKKPDELIQPSLDTLNKKVKLLRESLQKVVSNLKIR